MRVDYIDKKRCMAVYQMPLAEIVLDIYDKLKTLTRGYGSLEYRLIDTSRRPRQTRYSVNWNPVMHVELVLRDRPY